MLLSPNQNSIVGVQQALEQGAAATLTRGKDKNGVTFWRRGQGRILLTAMPTAVYSFSKREAPKISYSRSAEWRGQKNLGRLIILPASKLIVETGGAKDHEALLPMVLRQVQRHEFDMGLVVNGHA
jgi:hypothetical protein